MRWNFHNIPIKLIIQYLRKRTVIPKSPRKIKCICILMNGPCPKEQGRQLAEFNRHYRQPFFFFLSK